MNILTYLNYYVEYMYRDILLPKLPKELKESNDVYLWAKFIASEKKEEMEMLATKNKEIDQAYQHLQVISQDEQKKREYEQDRGLSEIQ